MRAAADRVSEYLSRRGWGQPRFDFAAANEGVLAISVARSALADVAARSAATPAARERACALLSGVFSGTLSHLAGRKLVAREVRCRAQGADECAFVVVASERAAVVDQSLQTGVQTLPDVRAALRRAPRKA
jgi:hypothetical protein